MYEYDSAINKSENFALDLLQVFQQKSIEQQSHNNSTEFFWKWVRDFTIAPEWFKLEYRAYLAKFTEVFVNNDPDLRIQVDNYLEDLDLGKKVLIVAHSQGNLYANAAYRFIETNFPDYKKSIGIVAVGTPANQVSDSISLGKFYTLNGSDSVINLLRGFFPVLPAAPILGKFTRGDDLNHSFKFSYIAKDGFRSRIKRQILDKIARLEKPPIAEECITVEVVTGEFTSSDNNFITLGRVEKGNNINAWMIEKLGNSVADCTVSAQNKIGTGPYNTGDFIPSRNLDNIIPRGSKLTYRACGKDKFGNVSSGEAKTIIRPFL